MPAIFIIHIDQLIENLNFLFDFCKFIRTVFKESLKQKKNKQQNNSIYKYKDPKDELSSQQITKQNDRKEM